MWHFNPSKTCLWATATGHSSPIDPAWPFSSQLKPNLEMIWGNGAIYLEPFLNGFGSEPTWGVFSSRPTIVIGSRISMSKAVTLTN